MLDKGEEKRGKKTPATDEPKAKKEEKRDQIPLS